MNNFGTVFRMPLFWLGVFLRLILFFAISSEITHEWYVPFLINTINFETILPWDSWVDSGGDLKAFPYGMGMLAAFVPFSWLVFFNNDIGEIFYLLTLFSADLVVFITTLIFFGKSSALRVTIAYWLSPILILACFGTSFN